MPPPVAKGSNKRSFCPSVACREPKGLACPNLERRFPTFDATRKPVSRSKAQRSRSPGPLMLTHRAPYLPNGKAYELQTWYMDGG